MDAKDEANSSSHFVGINQERGDLALNREADAIPESSAATTGEAHAPLQSAYVRYFLQLVDLTVRNQKALFSDIELKSLLLFQNDLDEASRTVFSRLLMRQGPWVRVDRLQSSLSHHVCASPNEFNEIIKRLYAAGLIELFSDKLHWISSWLACSSCLSVEELRDVYFKLSLTKAKGNKEQILSDLYERLNSSVDIFGRRLPIAQTVIARIRSSGSGVCGGDGAGSTTLIVCVDCSVLRIFRRAQRLAQVPFSNDNPTATVNEPLNFNAAILSIFSKVRFPDYKVFSTCALFWNTRRFRQWEAAQELFWAFGQIVHFSEKSLQMGTNNREEAVFSVKSLPRVMQVQLLRIVSTVMESCRFFNYSYLSVARSKESGSVIDIGAYVLGLPNSEGNFDFSRYMCMDKISSGGVTLENPLLKSDGFDWATDGPLAIGLLAVVCFASYCQELFIDQSSLSDVTEQRPEYMNLMDAGALLASMCSDAVELFEIEARKYKKDASPDEISSILSRISSLCVEEADSVNNNRYIAYYSLAIATLRSLISTPFLVHRRGKWYERLCIDLEHINKRDQAIFECKRALLDPSIEGGHRLGIEKRCTALSEKCAKQHSGPSTTSHDEVGCDFPPEVSEAIPPRSRKRRAKEHNDDVAEGVQKIDTISNDSKAELSLIHPDHQVSGFNDAVSLMRFLQKLYVEALRNRLLSPAADDKKRISALTNIESKSRSKYTGMVSSITTSSKTVSTMSQSTQLVATPWICKFCTLLNNEARRVCDACNTQCPTPSNKKSKLQPKQKPKDVVVAARTNNKTSVQLKFVKAVGAKSVVQKHEVVVISDDDDAVIETGATILESKTSTVTNQSPSDEVTSSYQGEDTNIIIDFCAVESAHPASMSLSDLNLLLQIPPIPIDIRDSCKTSNQLSSKWGNVISPSKNWGHVIVELTGRRIGDKRKGKNLLIGLDGDAVTVEELVMQFFSSDHIDEDERVILSNRKLESTDRADTPDALKKQRRAIKSTISDAAEVKRENVELSVSKPPKYTGGHWQGWHCEGSPLRTIFGIIMWDVLFMDVPNVFYSPYQDHPLDLLYGPLFYSSRAEAIELKFSWLLKAPMEEILAFVASTYHANYKARCRGVQWSHPLHLIQAVCLCLKGSGLVSLCKLLVANFRHFQGGAPDLLLIRGYRSTPPSKLQIRRGNLCSMCSRIRDNETNSSLNSSGTHAVDFEFINMDTWLGPDWRRFGSDRFRPLVHNEEDFYSLLHPRGSKVSSDNRFEKNAIVEFFRSTGRRDEAGSSSATCVDITEEPSSHTESAHEGVVRSDDYSSSNHAGGDDGAVAVEAEGAEGDAEVAPDVLTPAKYNKFAYYGPHLQNPCVGCRDETCDESAHGDALICYSWINEWTFECMFVEVKGPTDRLADRQAVWLHALEAGGSGAAVCQIREGRAGQQCGHHETGFAFMHED